MGTLWLCLAVGCLTPTIGDGDDDVAGTPDAGGGNDGAGADAPEAPPDAAPAIDARACIEGDRQTEDAAGNCYFAFDTPQTWEDGRNNCLAADGDLVRIDSSAENDLVFALARQDPVINDDWWVGGNDRANENVWVWLDDVQEMRNNLFTQFRSGEPNNSATGGEDCMIIETDNAAEEWDDRNCDTNQFPYVCERRAN